MRIYKASAWTPAFGQVSFFFMRPPTKEQITEAIDNWVGKSPVGPMKFLVDNLRAKFTDSCEFVEVIENEPTTNRDQISKA